MSKIYFMQIPKSLIHRSIWLEPPDVCKMWVTLLALQGPDHVVRESLACLAHTANLPLDTVKSAMQKFMDPDPNSSNLAHQGRRIKALAEGGWLLLNGEVYENLMRKEYNADAQKRHRATKKQTPAQQAGLAVGKSRPSAAERIATEPHDIAGGQL